MKEHTLRLARTTLAALFLSSIGWAAPRAQSSDPGSVIINIQAFIDGRSHLILDDETAQWHHFDYAAPGRHLCSLGEPIEPTIIHDVEWFPEWPDLTDCENRFCDCDSDVFPGVVPGVPNSPALAWIEAIDCRSECSIVEQPTQANGFRVVIEFNDNLIPDPAWYEINLVIGECADPVTYCSTNPNSTGESAQIGVTGSLSIGNQDAVLSVVHCPPGTYGLFCYGESEVEYPFGDGYLCINPFPVIHRLDPPTLAQGDGALFYPLEYGSLTGPGEITPGSTWSFQFWYRDPAAGGAGFNLSDGVRARFCP